MPEAPLEVAARVAAATAHEFNNHLAAIALQAELALVGAGEDEKLRRRLEGILGSCDAARAQTRALLAFGARRPLHSRQLDVGEALDRRAGPGVQVAVPEQRLFVDVDPDAFDEAVAELIAHAATPVTLSAQAAGDVVEIEVRHGGDTPDEEARRRIFEPYFAEDEERPLGLAVVWGFVRQSGGTIELQAAPGGGAVVIVRLPRAGVES